MNNIQWTIGTDCMTMANSGMATDDISQKLEEIDESLRVKYMEIVESLSINELKRFDKNKYKNMIKSEIF